MKRHLHSIFLAVGFGFLHTTLIAQELKVYLNQGSSSSFALNDLKKITFTNSTLNLHQKSGNVNPFSFDEIQRIRFEEAVGIKQVAPLLPSNVLIYPNPSSGIFTVDYTLDQPGKVVLELYGMNGERLFEHKSDITTSGVHSIHLAQGYGGVPFLANGFYYLRIQNTNGSISKKIAIIN